MPGAFRWYLLLTAVVALFFWKILFTGQFSILLTREAANQTYSWYSFAAQSIQQGMPPLWDPYTQSGHSFIGESQTGLFYPLKLPLYLWPFDSDGFLSERFLHQMYVLAHLLAAFFMFLCAREAGITSRFAAFVAAICFSLGGFTGQLGWPYMMDSALWLPLVFFLLLRAFRSETASRRLLYSCCGGLALAMTMLAGSIHVAFMDTLAIVSAAAFFALWPGQGISEAASFRKRSSRAVVIVIAIGVVSFAASAVQLLPSFEYAPLARRWATNWSGGFAETIPYLVTGAFVKQAPRAVIAFLLGDAETGGAEYGPYFGVLPLLLTVIGVARNWSTPWVKYLSGLALLTFVLSLGDYSLLHGLAYWLIPYFDKLWEAGRFIYLTHFAMALLAGFGVQSLLADDLASSNFYRAIQRVLGWAVAVLAVALGVPVLIGPLEIKDFHYFTFLLLISTWAAYSYLLRGNRGPLAGAVIAVVILCDLYAFNRTPANRMEKQAVNQDAMHEIIMTLPPVADFLRAQPGPFRVHYDASFPHTGMGNVYGIQGTFGAGVTMLDDYWRAIFGPNGMCLFNVRYLLASGSDRGEPPVFSSGPWQLYEQPSPCPRAWVVHQVFVESPEAVRSRMEHEPLDVLRVAYLSDPLPQALGPAPATPAAIAYGEYRAGRFELTADLTAAGLLVLSEVWYPGWTATVNGAPAHIHKVNGILRGVVVPPGSNHVVMEYRPASVRYGAALSLAAFFFTFGLAVAVRLQNKPSEPRQG